MGEWAERAAMRFLSIGIAGLLLASAAVCRGQAGSLLRGPVDDSERVVLRGNVHPLARVEYDRGRVEDSFRAERLLLVLKRSGERELALRQFLVEAHTPGAAGYHRWLTPEEFGARFGVVDEDLAAARAWLESHGFAVNRVRAGRMAIEFSGSTGQVAEAFHAEIHRYATGEREFYANDRDPQIPAAFADLIQGIAPMVSLHGQPLVQVAGRTSYNAKTHVAKADWTYPDADGTVTYELAPADFAMQYDLGPVYAAGTTGAGQSIGILSASNVDLSLVEAYRSLFGLAANLPTVVIDGDDPGQNSSAAEAYLDLEEAGAVAPAAKVVLYTSAGTVLTDPLLTSAVRAVEDNQVSVLSLSYGACEAALGASGNAAWALLWQQAAAQGITGFVAAGDAGAAGCDDFETEQFADFGLAVNGYGATPYNVAVGGTDFYFSDYAAGGSALAGQIANSWSAASSTVPATSLIQATPEQVWNDAFGLNAADGGAYNPADSTITAGGGGASSSAIYPATGAVAGYAKPAWQVGTGVPADKVRDVPDLALFAADGANFTYYPICAFAGDCVNSTSSGAVYVTSVGGTSAAAPAMAAIQALVDQATGSRQGQADFVYYALAAKTATLTAKPFRDVAVGGNVAPCDMGTPNCALWAGGPAKGFDGEGYLAGVGYDRASGLGSVDAANLIADWGLVSFRSTVTTLSVTPAVFAHGTTVQVNATVAAKTGSGVPTGSVGLTSTSPGAYANGLGVFALSGMGSGAAVTAPVDNLPGGTYQVVAEYGGDGVWGASASAPVTVTVAPEADTLQVSGWVVNPVDDYIYPLVAGMAIPYGAEVYLDAQPVGMNEADSALAENAPATGAVTFTDAAGTTKRMGTAALNSVGLAEWNPQGLAVGGHTLAAAYAGDGSYAASAATFAENGGASLTVFKGTTAVYISPLETSVAAGSSVTVDVEMAADYLPLSGTLPTGTVSVTLGSQTGTAPWRSWDSAVAGGVVEEAVVTFPNVAAGILPLAASYAGDANWNGASSLFGTVNSLAAKAAPHVTLTSAEASYTPSEMVTLMATVTGASGSPMPTGPVQVRWEGGAAAYNLNLQPGATSNVATATAIVPANELASGTNQLVATFFGDANYSAQSSAPLAITVNGGDFSLTTTTQTVPIPVGRYGIGSVTLTPVNGYSGTVTLSCASLASAAGIVCGPAAAVVSLGAAGAVSAVDFKTVGALASGTYPAVVTATGGGRVHTAQILVSYTPPAATPIVSVLPMSLTFPATAVGATTAAQVVTVTNTGMAAVTVNSYAFTGANGASFALSAKTCGTALAVGASCTLSVVFKPTAVGALTANLAATDNASGSPQTVALSGTGTTSGSEADTLTLSPAGLTFASTRVGATSAAQTVTVANTGTAAVTVRSYAFTGVDAGSFVLLGKTCGTMLAAGASCTLSVGFRPAASGVLSANLAATDSAVGSPQTMALSGMGVGMPSALGKLPPMGYSSTKR